MKAYLLDTNVLSEETRPEPNPDLRAWMDAHREQAYTTAITIAELALGVERLPNGRKRTRLANWLRLLVQAMGGRILRFDTRVALQWGRLFADLEKAGRTMSLADSLIAAIALRHHLVLATANIDDFRGVRGLELVNPFHR